MDLQVNERDRTFRVKWQGGDEPQSAVLRFHPLFPLKQVKEGRLELIELAGEKDREITVPHTTNPQYQELPRLLQTTYRIELIKYNGETVAGAEKIIYLGNRQKVWQEINEDYSETMVRMTVRSRIRIPEELFWYAFRRETSLNEKFYLPSMRQADDGSWVTGCLLNRDAWAQRRLELCFDERIRDFVAT